MPKCFPNRAPLSKNGLTNLRQPEKKNTGPIRGKEPGYFAIVVRTFNN